MTERQYDTIILTAGGCIATGIVTHNTLASAHDFFYQHGIDVIDAYATGRLVVSQPNPGPNRTGRIDLTYTRDPEAFTPTRTNIADWPYPDINNAYNAGDSRWHEVDEEIFWEQLECVPPRRMTESGFMVGEPYSHSERGAIHTCFMQVNGRYWGRMIALNDWNPPAQRIEIRRQITAEQYPDLERTPPTL